MLRLIALDLGNGYTKFYSTTEQGFYPSVFAIEEPGIDFAGLSQSNDLVIAFEGNRYAIGWSAWRLGSIPIRTLDRSRVTGGEYRVLFAAGLAATGRKSAEMAPVLSLPVKWYESRDQVREILAGTWEVRLNNYPLATYTVNPGNIRLIPEGFGALCSKALDRNGNPVSNGLLGARVGIVDIGTKTTDLIMFDSLNLVPTKTTGAEIGLEKVYNIMSRLADRELGHGFDIEQLDGVLNGESLHVGARDVTDLAHDWKYQALEQIAKSIESQIKTLWQGGNEVQRLLLTGGGAAHVYPFLYEVFNHVELVPGGAMANVIGAFRYGLLRGQHSHV